MLQNILERMKTIHEQKVAQWDEYDKNSIDYAVHGEEIADAKECINIIENGKNEDEIKYELRNVYLQTTSGRIYDLLGEVFPESYIPPQSI